MKKIFLAICMGIFLGGQAWADKAELFAIEEVEFNSKMEQLDRLEDYVKAHEGISYNEVKAQNSALVMNVADTPSIVDATQSDPPLGIPSFLWGCIFGVAGLAVVYFVTEDKEETKKALWGCVASTVVGIILYFAVFAAAASTAAAGA